MHIWQWALVIAGGLVVVWVVVEVLIDVMRGKR